MKIQLIFLILVISTLFLGCAGSREVSLPPNPLTSPNGSLQTLQSFFPTHPSEGLQPSPSTYPSEGLQPSLSTYPSEGLQPSLSTYPSEGLQPSLSTYPSGNLQSYPSTSSFRSLQSVNAGRQIPYTVRRGDTLRKIAQKYGTTYQDIARWNNLSPPYKIYPNQNITLYLLNRSTRTIFGTSNNSISFNDCGVQVVSVNTFAHRCGIFSLSKCIGAYYVIKNAFTITRTVTVKYRQRTLHENILIPAGNLIDGSEYNVAATLAPRDIVINSCY